MGTPVIILGFLGTIFNNVDIILFSFVGLVGVVLLNLELPISLVLAKFLDREDSVLLRGKARVPLSCLLRTVGVEELIRTASPLVTAFNDPLL